MRKKAISLIAVVILSVVILYGCKLPYNAVVIFSGAINDYKIVPDNSCFKSDFWRDNMLGNVFYKNENRDLEESDGEQYFIDETLPSERAYIIIGQEMYNDIFIDSQFVDIDFDNEMILLYIGRTVNSRVITVKSIRIADKKLTVEFAVKKAKTGYKDTCMPKRRLILLSMDKSDVDIVEFTEI